MVVSHTMNWKLEVIWNSLKDETQNTISKFTLLLGVWNKSVNDMHLKIK